MMPYSKELEEFPPEVDTDKVTAWTACWRQLRKITVRDNFPDIVSECLT
jgi:hypothetical protein